MPKQAPQSQQLVVVHHAHHKSEGVYRIVIARRVQLDGEEVYCDREDIVFADSDERWQGKTPDEIALTQRQLVKRALDERADAARRRARPSRRLPGQGSPL